MNIFLNELKANRKALIIWSICMFLLVLSGMGKYTAYSSGGGMNNQIFNTMPSSIKALLGINSLDVTTMSGFFALLFLYIEITVGIHAALLGSGIIAKEERDKTTEFLMVKPVSRSSVITAKLIAALINIIILNLVTFISSLIMIQSYNNGDPLTGELTMFYLSMFIVQLIFLTLGAFLAAFTKRPKISGSLATGILFIAYILDVITNLNQNLNFLNILSPFKYFDYASMAAGESLNTVFVLLSVFLIAIFSVLTYVFYRKRDLNV